MDNRKNSLFSLGTRCRPNIAVVCARRCLRTIIHMRAIVYQYCIGYILEQITRHQVYVHSGRYALQGEEGVCKVHFKPCEQSTGLAWAGG